MKATGIVRKVDGLGRVVLPIELRRILDIPIQCDLEIYVEGDRIVLKKYVPHCIFCGGSNGIREFETKNICCECVTNIALISGK